MFKLISISFLIIILNSCSTPQKEKILHYNISVDHQTKALKVKFDFSTNNLGNITLRYEDDSWGEKDLFNCIKNFDVVPKPEKIDFIKDSSIVRITGNPQSYYSINYDVKPDYEGEILNKHRYRPIVQKEYFHILGMRLFMTPDELFKDDTTKVKMTYSFKSDNKDYLFHSSFGTEHRKEIFAQRNQLYPSIFVGGDFRRNLFEIEGSPVHFLTRGNWKHLDEDKILSSLKKTIKGQRTFWNDFSDTLYTVTLIPTFEEWTETSKSYSLGGTGLTQSFASFASNNPGGSLQRIKWLYNHELFHNWIGTKIMNENEEKEYWFSEGFTDYYAYKLMLMNNEMDLNAFIKNINEEVIKPHYSSPVKDIPNSEITWEKFWGDYNYQKLPYRRGFLYAFLIDCQIKEKSKNKSSLNNLMLEIYSLNQKNKSFKFNAKVFRDLISKYLGPQALKDFDRYIINGKTIDFKNQLPKGLLLKNKKGIPQFELSKKSKSDLFTFLKS